MSEATFNEQAMTDYLLGFLSEADAERYDELSVADNDFAAALSACEKDLIDAYVQGDLAGGVVEQFRLHYLASPLRRDKVTFAKALQVFAERTAADVRSKDATDGASRQGWLAALSAFFAPRPALQWGLAAGVLILLVAGGWFALDNLRLRQQISQAQIRRDELQQREQALQQQLEAQHTANSRAEQELAQVRAERERLDQELKKQNGQEQRTQPQPPSVPGQTSIASFLLSPGLRGVGGQIQTLHIPPGSRRVALQVNLEPNDYLAYRVALIDQSNHQTLWQSGKLRARSADSGKALRVSLSSGLLKSQTYFIQVAGVSANGKIEVMSDYPFKVVK
jgi:anti-sigma factor RsiW